MPVRLATFLILLVVFTTLVMAGDSKRKHKKYESNVKDEALGERGAREGLKKIYRFPRQSNLNERRQYYPCISCFRVGRREICTSPYCPDNYQCDKASKRCHKKANVRGRPEEEEEVVDPAVAPPAPPQPGNVPSRGK